MPAPKTDWRVAVVAVVGAIFGIDAAFDNFTRGMLLKGLSALSLIGLFSPALLISRRRWLFRVAVGFCVFEILVSGLAFVGSIFSPMDPMSFTIHFFGIEVFYLDGLGGQFFYFAGRAAVFFAAIVLLLSRREEPNQPLEPTPPSVTPPAGAGVAPDGGVAHL
jgi:hypothetical protein